MGMFVSGHVKELTFKKAMSVRCYLKRMHERDVDTSHFVSGGKHAMDLALEVGNMLGMSKLFVYNSYREWKNGGDGLLRIGSFQQPRHGYKFSSQRAIC